MKEEGFVGRKVMKAPLFQGQILFLHRNKNLDWMKMLNQGCSGKTGAFAKKGSQRSIILSTANSNECPTPQRGKAFSIFAPSCLEFSGPSSFPFTSFDLPFFEPVAYPIAKKGSNGLRVDIDFNNAHRGCLAVLL